MNTALRLLAAVVLLAGASAANAAFHLFRLQQIYTNADGTVQFVVLGECCGTNSEHLWAGQTLSSTSATAGTKTFSFPTNLPSSTTANRRVLVATQGFAALGLIAPDYVMPDNFVPVGGGTLNYAGVHQVTFGQLPTDGTNAILDTGQVVPAVATNFAGQSASVSLGPPTALSIEFYHQRLDHYFITHRAPEIADLDSGKHEGWTRTQQSFRVFTGPGAATSPVCRYYIPPESGNSHFYGRGVDECNATGQKFPTFQNEDPEFFHVVLPVVGTCPAGTIPVYRVFNVRPGDANHRYTIDRTIRDRMVNEQHWDAEGDGDDRVVMCVPPTNPTASPAPPAPPPPSDDPGMPGDPGYPGYPYP